MTCSNIVYGKNDSASGVNRLHNAHGHSFITIALHLCCQTPAPLRNSGMDLTL